MEEIFVNFYSSYDNSKLPNWLECLTERFFLGSGFYSSTVFFQQGFLLFVIIRAVIDKDTDSMPDIVLKCFLYNMRNMMSKEAELFAKHS